MRNFFVVLACMTSILLIVACAKSPVYRKGREEQRQDDKKGL